MALNELWGEGSRRRSPSILRLVYKGMCIPALLVLSASLHLSLNYYYVHTQPLLGSASVKLPRWIRRRETRPTGRARPLQLDGTNRQQCESACHHAVTIHHIDVWHCLDRCSKFERRWAFMLERAGNQRPNHRPRFGRQSDTSSVRPRLEKLLLSKRHAPLRECHHRHRRHPSKYSP